MQLSSGKEERHNKQVHVQLQDAQATNLARHQLAIVSDAHWHSQGHCRRIVR